MGICLPDLPGGYPVGRGDSPARNRIITYLREHGPSTPSEIAGADKAARGSIATCLPTHPDWFERTGEKKKYGAEVWRLKANKMDAPLPVPVGGSKGRGKSPVRSHIIGYLSEYGPSTAAQIAGDTYEPRNISLCMRINPDLFKRTGQTGNQHAVVWRLKAGAT